MCGITEGCTCEETDVVDGVGRWVGERYQQPRMVVCAGCREVLGRV